jgi:DNA-binding MarR family transcriptional regulator
MYVSRLPKAPYVTRISRERSNPQRRVRLWTLSFTARIGEGAHVRLDIPLIACMIHIMNDRTDASTATEREMSGEAGMLGLLEVARVVQERVEAALESVGLSGPKYMTLEQLVRAGEPMSLSALADCRKCVRSNITQLVDRLEADGLVERVSDPVDRRAVLAAVTELGQRKFSAGTDAIRGVQAELAARVSTADRENFLRVLSAFRNR